jgi:hypothetical protein
MIFSLERIKALDQISSWREGMGVFISEVRQQVGNVEEGHKSLMFHADGAGIGSIRNRCSGVVPV